MLPLSAVVRACQTPSPDVHYGHPALRSLDAGHALGILPSRPANAGCWGMGTPSRVQQRRKSKISCSRQYVKIFPSNRPGRQRLCGPGPGNQRRRRGEAKACRTQSFAEMVDWLGIVWQSQGLGDFFPILDCGPPGMILLCSCRGAWGAGDARSVGAVSRARSPHPMASSAQGRGVQPLPRIATAGFRARQTELSLRNRCGTLVAACPVPCANPGLSAESILL